MDYLFLLQVHIEFMKGICVFVKTFERYFMLYVTKYPMCVLMKYLVIMTKRSNLSYY